MTREQLLARVSQFEDPFVERKSSPDRAEVIAAVVAFANSVPPEREAVLFLGLGPDGRPVGVDNPDPLQRKINDWLDETYPRVRVRYEVLADLGTRPVLAVIVGASDERPHFAGPAWVRDGSETRRASKERYEELIASRNSIAGAILRHQHATVTVAFQERWRATWNAAERLVTARAEECRIEGCTAHAVDLFRIGHSQRFSVPLSKVELSSDPVHQRALMITVREYAP